MKSFVRIVLPLVMIGAFTSPFLGAAVAGAAPSGPPIIQSSPLSGSTTSNASAAFSDQLKTNSGEPVTFSETSGSPFVRVSSSGRVTTSGNLVVGTYSVAGTDTSTNGEDHDGDHDSGIPSTGTWTYTLHVTAGLILQTPPTSGSTTTGTSVGFNAQRQTSGGVGVVTFTQSTGSGSLEVSSSGKISTSGFLGMGLHRDRHRRRWYRQSARSRRRRHLDVLAQSSRGFNHTECADIRFDDHWEQFKFHRSVANDRRQWSGELLPVLGIVLSESLCVGQSHDVGRPVCEHLRRVRQRLRRPRQHGDLDIFVARNSGHHHSKRPPPRVRPPQLRVPPLPINCTRTLARSLLRSRAARPQ